MKSVALSVNSQIPPLSLCTAFAYKLVLQITACVMALCRGICNYTKDVGSRQAPPNGLFQSTRPQETVVLTHKAVKT